MRPVLIWGALIAVILWPVAMALGSPLLQWREPVYIVAGFAGVLAMALLVMQPLLAAGLLPGLPAMRGRLVHRWVGGALVLTVLIHVGGLWITSPPDVVDALLFRSPTPFSVWGVMAMWAVFATATLAIWRKRLRFRTWRAAHMALAAIIVLGCVIHALLIEGTMEIVSKVAVSIILITIAGIVLLRPYLLITKRRV
ncbi:ferric reductase-like transmembrane domain-containing protein [Cognatiyoonia sp. IB215182]|uniref:ferric reductase-like transmembrane domain-containing protein n=1 Tax=Cognatiyoonia sp. IB215182 TaxID=3097353 RepID=UPI002A0D1A27|nr:ferric reductase-like transmembrane domain-containing protein [Cognatiyoonia sp. IB215182]MDX8355073.1 ferric reductase-like transmembrane domain-containing protein [Cognatiyoonia sp. IB215182]